MQSRRDELGLLLRRLVKAALLLVVTAAVVLLAYGIFLVQNLGLDRVEIERRAHASTTGARAETGGPRALAPGDIPDYVRAAFITAEDRHFRWHFGVDPLALARAAVSWVRAHAGDEDATVTGGSTISMQLAKILFLGRERTLKRKLDQMVLAVWLEWLLSKEEILALYLNNVYFGDGMYGIEAAARHYFGRSVVEPPRIDLFEAAMLARTVPAPSLVNPNRNRDALEKEARALIAEMARQGRIGAAEPFSRGSAMRPAAGGPTALVWGAAAKPPAAGSRDIVNLWLVKLYA